MESWARAGHEAMKTSVIISTYNSPLWLQKVLWGYFAQDNTDFEIIIADDGSDASTGELLTEMARSSPVPITHVWQPDDGFRKCAIINKAIAVARGDRILTTDGDCVPRRDFIGVHARYARPDRFLSGGYFKLGEDLSNSLDRDLIEDQRAFSASWLVRRGMPINTKAFKLVAAPPFDTLLNRIVPTRRTWNGHNASCDRSLAIRVNGFNEDMQYGGLDGEFGVRLGHTGVFGDQIRYSAVVLHLHHGRGYVTPEMIENSRAVRRRTREEKKRRADRGLDQWLRPDGEVTLAPDDRLVRL
jgi:glycosyltransferase involved in cell wall biosynthesis